MRLRLLFVPFFIFASVLANAALAQPLPAATPESVGLSSQRLANIGKVLAADVDKGALPGAVVAVARKGKLVYFEAIGFRDKPAGKPMLKDAIFRVYSMTKPWTSVAAMILVEEGHIQLTDPNQNTCPLSKT